MKNIRNFAGILIVALLILQACNPSSDKNRIALTVNASEPGSPITMGVPFPQGALLSPDHVRVLDSRGREIASQITEVSTWEPVDNSIKWIWVFFFADQGEKYTLEYGENVRRAPVDGPAIVIINNQREQGGIEVNTGTLRFKLDKRRAGGFLDVVEVNSQADGFREEHIIATSTLGRGSFMDMLDERGIDASKAVIHQAFVEKGSGPLHSIIRIEGEYQYNRADNPAAPFVTRVHAFAGKSYIRVYHTITYTGVPDKSRPLTGQHPAVATRLGPMVDEIARLNDAGMTQPNDMINAIGLSFNYKLGDDRQFGAGYYNGEWWNPGTSEAFSAPLDNRLQTSVFQTGPHPTGIPPNPTSTADERMSGFKATFAVGNTTALETERATGWMDLNDGRRGISIGIRNFIEEYPKEILVDPQTGEMVAYLWTPKAGPMSFQRADQRRDGDMVANFATGLTKTTELVYYFYDNIAETQEQATALSLAIDPPAAHAEPAWYAASGAFGNMAPYSQKFDAYERGLSYKYDWFLFNQVWEPWFGMFYYGDGMTNYYNNNWNMWGINEPAQDFMWWTQYVRTGDRKYYIAAQNMSRYSMDVGNIHWPAKPKYRGDYNLTDEWFEHEALPESSPYVGMGRRHGGQPWVSVLTAHVWVPGWVASYYLDGYHRGLDIAKLTADHYLRRVWGEHDFRGRRLYLGIYNLAAVYDATKDQAYFEELTYRIDTAIQLQAEQGWSMNIDRYGYSQNYNSHGLLQYYNMTGDERVANAIVRHARRVRDVKPFDHDMESYLASIHSLIAGYEISGERSFLDSAVYRSEALRTGKLQIQITSATTQREFADALDQTSNLPGFEDGRSHPFFGTRPIWAITNGLRVFGWTHAYNVPWLLHHLENEGMVPQP
jgi:hypothetical protein